MAWPKFDDDLKLFLKTWIIGTGWLGCLVAIVYYAVSPMPNCSQQSRARSASRAPLYGCAAAEAPHATASQDWAPLVEALPRAD